MCVCGVCGFAGRWCVAEMCVVQECVFCVVMCVVCGVLLRCVLCGNVCCVW